MERVEHAQLVWVLLLLLLCISLLQLDLFPKASAYVPGYIINATVEGDETSKGKRVISGIHIRGAKG